MILRNVAATLFVFSGLTVACGGSVVDDSMSAGGSSPTTGGSTAVGGSTGSAGKSTANGGNLGIAGNESVGGSTGGAGKATAGGSLAGGSAGHAAPSAGNNAGGNPAGGAPPAGCCDGETACLGGDVCVEGTCQPPADPGQCWTGADCASGNCSGASICPCGVACFIGSHPGMCLEGTPVTCCASDGDCPAAGDECAEGTCEPPLPAVDANFTPCWRDSDCGDGSTCLGAQVCPCGSDIACSLQDQWGKCSTTCTPGGACGPDGATCMEMVGQNNVCCGTSPLTCENGTWSFPPECNIPAQMCPDAIPVPGSSCSTCGLPESCFYPNNSCSMGVVAACNDGVWQVGEPPCAPTTCSDTSACAPGYLCVYLIESFQPMVGECQPNPCGDAPVSCACAASLCDGTGTVCESATSTSVTCDCTDC